MRNTQHTEDMAMFSFQATAAVIVITTMPMIPYQFTSVVNILSNQVKE
jgi:hypothetical protein